MRRTLIDALVSRGITQPIDHAVAADDDAFLARKGAAKIALRVARRSLELAASGQRRFERAHIDPAWRRALWLHVEAPQIGDALMDLAPRTLLAERGIGLDLLAPATIAALFAGDRAFGRVFADAAQIEPMRYDFVIADSRAWKALAIKRRRLTALPWVSIKGDYLGYDYHRGLFATRRLAQLLGAELDEATEWRHARQKLCLAEMTDDANGAGAAEAAGAADEADEADEAAESPGATRGAPGTTCATRAGAPRVALALGGVRCERSYAHWPDVAAHLRAAGIDRFTLLGSANGRAARAAVLQRLDGADVLDLVERTDLGAARQAMREAHLVLCADGGLMHLALTTTTPVVSLFDARIDPAWRLPMDMRGQALRAATNEVSVIEPTLIASTARTVLAAQRVPASGAPA